MIKNDRVDCRRLAKNYENGDYKSCFIHPKELREDRQIARTYDQFKKDIIRVSNRIRKALDYHGIFLYHEERWTLTKYKAAKNKIKELQLSNSLDFSLSMLLEELNYLRSERKAIIKKLYELAASPAYKKDVDLIQSIPGIGKLTAIKLRLELGDITRFKRKESFNKFLGLIPSDYSTGKTERKGHITKQGNPSVRGSLIESAWVGIRKDPVLLKKYNSIISHCGSAKKAIVGVARKLASRMRAVVIHNEPYQLGIVF
jgi:transposase